LLDNIQREFLQEHALWKEQADAFALYYLKCFRPGEPWGGHQRIQDPSQYHWETFCEWVQKLEQSTLMVDKLRLDNMLSIVYGLRTKTKDRKLLGDYRYRNRTKWTEEEKNEIRSIYPKPSKHGYRADKDFDELEHLAMRVFTPYEQQSVFKELSYCRKQTETLQDVFGLSFLDELKTKELMSLRPHNNEESSTDSNAKNDSGMSPGPVVLNSEEHSILSKANDIMKIQLQMQQPAQETAQQTQESSSNAMRTNLPAEDLDRQVDEYMDQHNLALDQRRVVLIFKEYFSQLGQVDARKSNPPKPPIVIMTGDPGAGKSYATETVAHLVTMMKVGTHVSTSYNGIAAFNIDGQTLCKTLGMPTAVGVNCNSVLTRDRLQQIRLALASGTMVLFIVDEVSTLDAPSVGMIDRRLKQILESDEDFGGVSMLFVGDFNQLGPVLKIFIPKDMIEWARHVNKVSRAGSAGTQQRAATGSTLPATAPTADIATAVRNKGGLVHRRQGKNGKKADFCSLNRYALGGMVHRGCSLLERATRVHLTEQQRSSEDEKHSKFVQKLSDGHPILLDDIRQYKRLSQEDVKHPNSGWMFAPILVSNNRERINIVRMQAIHYAKKHNTHVFKWKAIQRNWTNKPPPSHMSDIEENNACFWEFFVAGPDGFLNFNVNGSVGLVNGAAINYHSMSYDDEEIIDLIQFARETLPFGTEIILPRPPDATNVAIQPTLDGKQPSSRRLEQLKLLRSKSIQLMNDRHNGSEGLFHTDVGASLDDCQQEIIIPILPHLQGSDSDYHKIRSPSHLYPVCSVQLLNLFPLELAFAMTIHKAQGRTIPKVILALESRPSYNLQMEFPAIFVAMSRVKKGDDMRVLHSFDSRSSFEDAFSYLTKLKPNRSVSLFYSGYINDNGPWQRQLALQNAAPRTPL
jgi:hypothetical protein